jgi:hypothetical protein
MQLIQENTFLTREGREGLQVTTCLNEQKNIVLKLFKTLDQSYEQMIKRWMSANNTSKEWYENSFLSYRLAYTHLKDETWLLYYHDWSTDVWNIVINGALVSTLWTPFLVQKKTILVCEKIDEYVLRWDITSAKKVIDDVFFLINKIRSKWITEDTFNYDHNYWYDADGNMVQIDVWSFREWESFILEQKQQRKMLNNSTSKRLLKKSEELYEYHLSKCNELYK